MTKNIWHDISPKRINTEDFICVIEISKGSKKKYELDKETGYIKNLVSKESGVEFASENYVATKNTCVGMSFEDVKTTLGEPQEETELVLVYNLSETTAIRFTQENSVVSMIEYEEIK